VADLPSADDWQVFHGEASPAAARIYVRMRLPSPPAVDRLRGEITGPFSRYARTLPATTRIDAVVRSQDVLAETVLIDPCFWTPGLPYLYRVRLSLESSGQALWNEERTFGIRRLGVRGRQFVLEGKAWVLRGGMVHDTTRFDWDAWREQELAAFVREPEEAFCAEADQRGVLLAARVAVPETPSEALLHRWQRHPSVGLVVVPAEAANHAQFADAPSNWIIASDVDGREQPPPWADALVCKASFLEQASSVARPVIVVRSASRPIAAAAIRSECDRLQRDLAGQSQFSGYLV
jgi:hypothetical protein